MNTTTLRTTALCLLISLSIDGHSQTHTLADKRHSLSPRPAVEQGRDRLGLPPSRLIYIERTQACHPDSVSYTTFHHGWGWHTERLARIDEHPVFNDPAVDLDSLRRAHPLVQFIGFTTASDTLPAIGYEITPTVPIDPMPRSCDRPLTEDEGGALFWLTGSEGGLDGRLPLLTVAGLMLLLHYRRERRLDVVSLH